MANIHRIGLAAKYLTCFLAVCLAATAQAAQREIVVAASGGDFTSIGAALDSVNPTATDPYLIRVLPGTYSECDLTLKSHVHLQGAGRNVTTIRCSALPARQALVLDNVTDVIVSGFRVTGRGIGIKVASSPDAAILDNRIEMGVGSSVGVSLEQGSSLTVQGNQFVNNHVGLRSISSSPLITGNDFRGSVTTSSVAIAVSNTAPDGVDDSSPTISANLITDGANGIRHNGSLNAGSNSAPVVIGNTITNNSGDGIRFDFADDQGTVQANTVSGNAGYGLFLRLASPSIIHNRIINNGGDRLADINISGSRSHVSFNIFDTVSISSFDARVGGFNLTSEGAPAP